MPPSGAGAAPITEATQRVVIIEEPILNSPYDEPTRHFRFTEEGITNEIVEKRRTSAYFIPVPRPRNRRREQLVLDTEWTADRLKENDFINSFVLVRPEWEKIARNGALGADKKRTRNLGSIGPPFRAGCLLLGGLQAAGVGQHRLAFVVGGDVDVLLHYP